MDAVCFVLVEGLVFSTLGVWVNSAVVGKTTRCDEEDKVGDDRPLGCPGLTDGKDR